MSAQIEWGIVILNWHQTEATLRCIRSVESALLRAQVQVKKKILADNQSTPKSREEFQTANIHGDGWEILALESNLGFAGGLNAALHTLSSFELDRVLLLNNDTRLDSNAIDELLHFTIRHAALKIIGLDILENERGTRQTLAGYRYNSWFGFESPVKTESEAETRGFDYISGAAMLCDAKFLKEIGGIPSSSFLYFEELRLADALPSRALLGHCAAARVHHGGGLSSEFLLQPSRHYFAALACFKYTRERYWYKLPSVIATRLAWLALRSIVQKSRVPVEDGARATIHLLLGKTASINRYLEPTNLRE